ncbi:hypothetical protein [Anaerorhabdus sp.]|uniref:hypothetical protein n=1 Tax=Anaerorhabdus sp. TaxID=1872524 RepID=UPI002FC93869
MKRIIRLLLVFAFITISILPLSAELERGAIYQNLLKRYCNNFSGDRIIEVYADIEVYSGGTLQGRKEIPDIWVAHMDCYDIYYENGYWIN